MNPHETRREDIRQTRLRSQGKMFEGSLPLKLTSPGQHA
jgi:hypothetical protein